MIECFIQDHFKLSAVDTFVHRGFIGHLLGFDHKESPEAAAMERLEVSSLARLGIGDPFSDNAGVEFTRLRK